MSLSNYRILPVSSADVPILTNHLHSSKLSLSINRLLWNNWLNEKAQKAAYSGAVAGSLGNPLATSLVVDDQNGEIIGYMAFEKKHPSMPRRDAPENAQYTKEKPHGPDGANPDVIAELGRALPIIAGEVQALDRYVSYICVQPPHRGQGIGRDLMLRCFGKAKEEGVPVAVCAEPAALEFFLKLGFKETKHADMDLAKIAVPFSGFGLFRLTGLIWHP